MPERRDKLVICTICGRIFSDIGEFLNHHKETGHWPGRFIEDYEQ